MLHATAARVLLGAGEWRTMRRGCAKAACWLHVIVLLEWTRVLLIPSTFSILAFYYELLHFTQFVGIFFSFVCMCSTSSDLK